MLTALRHPTYRRLFAAQVVALAGTGLLTVALGLLAHDIAGVGAGRVLGTILAVKMIAYVLVAPVTTALVHRAPRRLVLISSDMVRLAIALLLPFLSETWQVLIAVFVLQAASATFTPTFQSVIPDVLPDEEDYTAALSLSRLAYDLEAVLSPLLAAALLLVVPFTGLFVGTGLGFAVSALLVLGAAIPATAAGRDAADDVRDANDDARDMTEGTGGELPFLRRVSRGTTLFLSIPALRAVLALHLTVAAVGAFVLVQTVVIVRDVLELGEPDVAVMLGVHGAGSMLAALALPRLLRGRGPVGERRVMLGGAVLLVVAGALIALGLPRGSVVLVGVLWAAVGVGWSMAETPVGRVLRRSVDPRDLPAVFAAQFSLSHACWLLTYPLAGWLGAWSLTGAAWGLTALAAAAAVTAVVLWPRAVPGRRSPGTSPGIRASR
ncbi:MFS transporter [Brachybacterium sillae]|uniref:MFS transporter n=1 Tax=Brachybacterium sillae TaxID=2810536 RepID=UPI00217CC398|nr:MFS transporter [Brachybacterium sillae]